ncbi:MAG: pyridoxamine 5'-phosphate oxidase family protein [Kiritimatiellae bacterium]|nr:pyridoxamine 5'-phosphate oxidase family protein [Kiritimatiellia bacterium]
MGKEYPQIDAKMQGWITQQKVFFVATAPLSIDGMVNCSPKGMDTFRVIDPHTVAYLDLTGSGIETVSHIKENRRVVIMMCAFEGAPKIVRFHGHGQICEVGTVPYQDIIGCFPKHKGTRSIIKVNVTRVSDSCGFSVPIYEYCKDRDTLTKWGDKKGVQGLKQYRNENNKYSLDGLIGLDETLS